MFGYMLKNLPAKYVFAGYSVRKSYTILTSVIDGRVVYDSFLYTYIDNYLSFYLLMDNGKYKNVETNEEVPLCTAEDLISRHISRGKPEDDEDYEGVDKNKIVGVFGVRDMETLMKIIDAKAQESDSMDIKLEAMLDIKDAYMGMEITGTINRFNTLLGYPKDTITIPAIKNGVDDPFESVIGDEMDFFDLVSNKTADEIVADFKKLSEQLDGIGNRKK